MSVTPPTPVRHAGRRPPAPGRWGWAVVLAALAAVAVPSRGAADPVLWRSAAPKDDAAKNNDALLALRVAQVLREEEVLQGQWIGVQVANGSATLFGKVNSLEARQRAEQVVRTNFDLRVVNELSLNGGSLLTVPRPTFAEPLVPFRSPSPQTVASRPRESETPPTGPEVPGVTPSPTPPRWRAKSATLVPPSSPALAPMAPTARVVTVPKVLPPPGDPLRQHLDALQRAEGRFRGLRPIVVGGEVRLRGTVYRWEDLHDFARRVARIPGVRRVFIEDIREDSQASGRR